jgi:glutathione S-transferase
MQVTLTLYYSPGSCALAPHIALEEIGAPFALVLVDTDQGEGRTPEFRRINPKGRVPVLVENNFLLTEAPAILLHLAMSHSGAGLMSSSGTGLVRTVEWFNWLSGSVHAVAVRMIWRPYDFTIDTSQTDVVMAKGKELLADSFNMINERLQPSEWALDDLYSIVDIFLLVFYRWGNRMKIDMKADYPVWTEHTHRMLERPAVIRALAQENISVWE